MPTIKDSAFLANVGRSLGTAIQGIGGYSAKTAAQANAVSAQAQSAQGAFNQQSANQANMLNDNTLASQYSYNSAQAASANAFTQEMWEKAAAWNEAMWQKQADFNAAEAQKNRDWQENMSNTQYQRAMKDMAAAGLNPILAYQNGGAGVPGGSMASVGGAQMSSAQGQMASGGLLDSHQAQESNYTGQMEYMGGTLGLISAVIGGISSAMQNLGSLGDLGEGLGKALSDALNPAPETYEWIVDKVEKATTPGRWTQNKEYNKGKSRTERRSIWEDW